MFNFYL